MRNLVSISPTNLFKAVIAAAMFSVLLSCTSTTQVGATGVDRKQLLLVSSEQINAASVASYNQTLSQAKAAGKLDTDAAMRARLQRISNRLVSKVSTFRPEARSWQWEVHTIKSDELNAYVAPGGKIMFYTGIIDRLNLTDAEIAAIMGHEMAHALREHARERISTQMATQSGLGILGSLAGLSTGQLQLADMVSQVGLSLPHNRSQESEADVLGLELMARAGYNPQSAVTLWRKMEAAAKGAPPQFLSTHPSAGNRIAQIQSLLPRVMPLYNASSKA